MHFEVKYCLSLSLSPLSPLSLSSLSGPVTLIQYLTSRWNSVWETKLFDSVSEGLSSVVFALLTMKLWCMTWNHDMTLIWPYSVCKPLAITKNITATAQTRGYESGMAIATFPSLYFNTYFEVWHEKRAMEMLKLEYKSLNTQKTLTCTKKCQCQ